MVKDDTKELFNEEMFQSLKDLEKIKGLNVKGLYAIKLKYITAFPEPFRDELSKRKTNLIYIGKGNNIGQRLSQECRGKGHGTFFRGIGAILEYRPPKGSLIGRANQHNYEFSDSDKEKIVSWMNKHLEFNFVPLAKNTNAQEEFLIGENRPLLNSKHNPQKSKNLAQVRKICRDYSLKKCDEKECGIKN